MRVSSSHGSSALGDIPRDGQIDEEEEFRLAESFSLSQESCHGG